MTLPRSGWLAIGVLIVALAGQVAGWLAIAATAGLMGTALGLAALRRTHARTRTSAALVAFGSLVMAARLVGAGLEPETTPELPTGHGPWEATVEITWAPRDGQQLGRVRLAPASVAAGPGGSSPEAATPSVVATGVAVLATLPRYPDVVPGDRLLLAGAIRPFGDDERGDSLRASGMAGSIRAERMTLLPAAPGPARTLEDLRRGAGDALGLALPEPAAGLAAGILIGLRDRVDRALAADFTTAGVSHVVAISGWNIAIVGAGVGALGGRLRRRRRAALIGIAIALYVAFAGASPAVLRAGAMAGIVLLARESARPARAAMALGWAIVVLLLVEPSLIADVGFQLSTAATAGLIAWATPLAQRLEGADPGRLRAWLSESLGVSLAAQAATMPLVLLSFERLSLVAPAVNLAVVPLVPPAMAAGLVALVGGLAANAMGVPAIAATIGLPAWALLTAIIAAVRIGADLPLASVPLEPPAHLVGASLALAAFVLVPRAAAFAARRQAGTAAARPRRTDRRARIVVAALVVAVTGAGIAIIQRPDGRTTVTILDVGQGDAILVEGGRGGRLLVDGGPDPERLLAALGDLLPPWDRRIDAIVLTHPHEDHVAGLVAVLERYVVGGVFTTPMAGPGPGYAAWDALLERMDVPRGIVATGSRLRVDDVRLDVLWPDPGTVPRAPPDDGSAINDTSIVLLGETEGRRFLLTGDIEEGVDPELVRRGIPAVDLLKVAHHGSRTASTEAFLAAARPTIAVTSAGAKNRYGHPAPATMERLAEVARRVLRTDRDGSVSVILDRDGLEVRTGGPRAAAAAGAGRGDPARGDPARGDPARGLATGSTVSASAFGCALPTSLVETVRIGSPVGLLYHRVDDRSGDPRLAPRPVLPGSSARPVLGRRRLRTGRGDRRAANPDGRSAGVRPGAVADARRRWARRPADRPADRTPGDRLDVRRRDDGRRGRDRPARQARCGS